MSSSGSAPDPSTVSGETLGRYLVAFGAFVAACLFRFASRNQLGTDDPYLQFYPAIRRDAARSLPERADQQRACDGR